MVTDINLSVGRGAFVTLLGPSGCGKTTTLRMIAGLETPSSGTIEIDGVPIFEADSKLNIPASKRPIAMVFQSYAIWPHLSIFQNVAFPLESGRFNLSRTEIRDRTEEALLMVGLKDYSGRDPSALSGGQQQRVALARALVSRPKLLLLDEPLSNLDIHLRDQMRDQIRELHVKTQLTTIFVTHDQNEAMALSTHIVVMNHGKIVETGAPHQIFQSPHDQFTAKFVGKHNIFTGIIMSQDDSGYAIVATDAGDIKVKVPPLLTVQKSSNKVMLYMRPDAVKLRPVTTAQSTMKGLIVSRIYQGYHWEVKVTLKNGETLLVHTKLSDAREIGLNVISEVEAIPIEDEVVVVWPEESSF